MKNRYDNILRTHNAEILTLTPANQVLHTVVAYNFAKLYRKGNSVLEIGCGEGDSTLPLLSLSQAELTALDVSPDMIRICKNNLRAYKSRVQYICDDALNFLKHGRSYDIIISSWTIHNFTWSQKKLLFKAICNALPSNGKFLLMDKIYLDKKEKVQYQEQIERYKLLPRQIAKAIIAHEVTDFSLRYRMSEKQTLQELRAAGFKKVKIADRVTRDAFLIAFK
ncbi:MAG: class I SAM-dependent methyltransferase [Candidatus Doudnabacteria bacterium]|nr:class I SAM-dependent methyltransferase [Candidatus Doudnabacteria bacterium]